MGKSVLYSLSEIIPKGVKPLSTRKGFINLSGKRFTNLTVVGYAGSSKWWCTCVCDGTKVFKTTGRNLYKGLTKSCGCLRKNNGKSLHISIKAAQKDVENFKLKVFSGWKNKSVGICNTCGKEYEVDNAYYLRTKVCCKKDNIFTLESKDICMVGGKYYCLLCNASLPSSNSVCLCRSAGESDNISSVYILIDKGNSLFKIGKGNNPYTRTDVIIRSAKQDVGLVFELYKILWVSNPKVAYQLESILHKQLKRFNTREYKFDGSTETFECDIADIENALHLQRHNIHHAISGIDLIKPNLIADKMTRYLTSLSVEFDGKWFPSKTKVACFYGIPKNDVSLLLDAGGLDQYLSLKASTLVESKKLSVEKFNKDWGDGIYGNIRQLARDNNVCSGVLWHRINVMGMTMKEALYLDTNDHHYLTIGNRRFLKKDLGSLFGVSWSTVYKRIMRGWEPKYAVLPLGKVKDYIININGNIYSPASLLRHFNLTKGILTPTNKNPMLRDRLILKGTITEDDYFELIHIN